MSSINCKKDSANIPLCALAFLCFFTLFMSHTRLTIVRKPQPETAEEKQLHIWTLWNYNRTNVYGLFLKAVVVISSPFLSLASTLFLLTGVKHKNPYLYLPWLLFTLRGLLAVQASNFFDAFRVVLEKNRRFRAAPYDWRSLALYSVIFVFDGVECFCFFEVARMFKTDWVNRLKILGEDFDDLKEESPKLSVQTLFGGLGDF